MVMFHVRQVWPKPSCKAQSKGEEDKAGKRGGKTTLGNEKGMEFAKSQGAVENREKWRKLVVKSSICGAPMTPAVKR